MAAPVTTEFDCGGRNVTLSLKKISGKNKVTVEHKGRSITYRVTGYSDANLEKAGQVFLDFVRARFQAKVQADRSDNMTDALAGIKRFQWDLRLPDAADHSSDESYEIREQILYTKEAKKGGANDRVDQNPGDDLRRAFRLFHQTYNPSLIPHWDDFVAFAKQMRNKSKAEIQSDDRDAFAALRLTARSLQGLGFDENSANGKQFKKMHDWIENHLTEEGAE